MLDWLCYDLNKQRENIAKEFGIKSENVEENYLILNIGRKNPISIKTIELKFYFDISIITNVFCNSKR